MEKAPKNQHRKWIQFSQMGVEMAVVITGMVLLGDWLDKKYESVSPLFTVVLSLLGVFLAIFNVIRKINAITKEDE